MDDLISRQDVIDALWKIHQNRPLDSDRWVLADCVREIDALPSAQPYSLDEWCDTCKEYDQERHSCPRFNHVIRTTLDDVRKEAYKHGKSKGIKKGMAMAKVQTPCDLCRFNPPSSADGKPCTMCPAEPYKGEQG